MESFLQITESPKKQDQSESLSHFSVNYAFSQENLDDIPHPDDNSPKRSNPHTIMLASDSELAPLPLVSDSKSSLWSNIQITNVTSPTSNFSDIIPPSQIPLPETSNYQNKNFSSSQFTIPLPRCIDNQVEYNEGCVRNENVSPAFKNQDDQQEACVETKTFMDNTKYSPSRVESDDENQDFISAKPKVLGKEQAKRRLMAFSISKQSNATVKKQCKVMTLSKSIKEKPPNPNKSTGVQEQFRTTISEIEEEKKKMMQNMPNYFLLEMNDLAKSTNPVLNSSLKLIEKNKVETANAASKDISKKDAAINASVKHSEPFEQKTKGSNKKNARRSKSPTRSYRRSRSRSKQRKHGRGNRRSPDFSKSRKRSKSRSPRKTCREEKKFKHEEKNNEFLEKIKDLPDNWKSFKLKFGNVKPQSEETKWKEGSHRRSQSPNDDKWNYKPTYNYLKRERKMMTHFQAKPAESRGEAPGLYFEKKIKYTKAKPMIIWAENPSCGTEFYMSRQMLLDNCDSATASIMRVIMDGKENFDGEPEKRRPRSHSWYSLANFLLPEASTNYDDFEVDVPREIEKSNYASESAILSTDIEENLKIKNKIKKEDAKPESNGNQEKKKRNDSINLINDNYLSDEESDFAKVNDMVVGNVKVKLDLDLSGVKVRSKWDSDYEGENSEKEPIKEVDMEIATPEEEVEVNSFGMKKQASPVGITVDNQGSKSEQVSEKKKSDFQNLYSVNLPKDGQQLHASSDEVSGNLASEYEEFLKMVSFDSNSSHPVQNHEKTGDGLSKFEKQKIQTAEKSAKESAKPKFEMTDWDEESDREEKRAAKVDFSKNKESDQEMMLLNEEKTRSRKKREKKNSLTKKKADKYAKAEKLLKKFTKIKKKKYDTSSSSESSSDSYDSESDSDSDRSKSSRKKKKKVRKIKKRSRKYSSSSESESESESESDSDDEKSKKKGKKKKEKKRKKSSESSNSDEGKQNALLKRLDFKKQLIMKKIEEIDSISERTSGKKKVKESKQKKKEKEIFEDADSLEKYIKSMKKKKSLSKTDKSKKKSKSSSKSVKSSKEHKKINTSSESDDDDDEEEEEEDEDEDEEDSDSRKKKEKSRRKKKPVSSSESSDSDDGKNRSKKKQGKVDKSTPSKNSKSTEKSNKKAKKEKKKRSSSSDSVESEDDRSKEKKSKRRKSKRSSDEEKEEIGGGCDWEKKFLLEDEFRLEEKRLDLKDGNLEWNQSVGKRGKDIGKEDNWEDSSSPEKSVPQCKTRDSWEDDLLPKNVKLEIPDETADEIEMGKKVEASDFPFSENDAKEKGELMSGSEGVAKPAMRKLKTSLSNFSFNENSFCGFGQELSRDFFLTEHSFSTSEMINATSYLENCSIESRPFQSVAQSNEVVRNNKSELYSPGHSDSESSDIENGAGKSSIKEEVYDPLNSGSETSTENVETDLRNIPLPRVSDILLPGESRRLKDGKNQIDSSQKNKESNSGGGGGGIKLTSNLSAVHTSAEFSSSSPSVVSKTSCLNVADKMSTRKQVINVKSQQKLKSKAASVFQEESDEEITSVVGTETKTPTKGSNLSRNEDVLGENRKKTLDENVEKRKESQKTEVDWGKENKKVGDDAELVKDEEKIGERRETKERRKKRSRSRERKGSRKSGTGSSRKRSRTPEATAENVSPKKREIRSDSFEIEPLKSATEFKELIETVQPIPVLTGLGVTPSDRNVCWNRSQLPGYTSAGDLSDATGGGLIDNAESFDIYPSDDVKFRNDGYFDKGTVKKREGSRDESSSERSGQRESKRKRDWRRSRSRSSSPRKKHRSKTPEKRKSGRNRSPRRRSSSPSKRREKSPYSPRRRSPKRTKSPSRRYRNSRSPDRRRKSRSRSPRNRRGSPSSSSRRSRSLSPRKHRSPKRRDSPRRRNSSSRTFSPGESMSPRREGGHFSHDYQEKGYQNRIPVIGGVDKESSPSKMTFTRNVFAGNLNEPEIGSDFYNREYPGGEFAGPNYPDGLGGTNLITLKNPDLEKPISPERPSLDERIELELGVPMTSGPQGSSEQYQQQQQGYKQFHEVNPVHFQNSYNCENNNGDNFYQNQNIPPNSDFNSQYYNVHHQPMSGFGPFQQYSNSQPGQGSMLQVGNIVEVVPSMQPPAVPPPSVPAKNGCHQIMQVGNVLQVVPSQKSASPTAFPPNYGGSASASPVPPVKTQKATAVVAPSSIVPTPNPEAVINPLIKAIQLEREKRKKEKEKRKAEREARRKARQLKREAKLMSVNEKLKKSVQDEGLMLGQEVEDDELADGIDLPSPPIPVEIITVSSPGTLPPAGKGILITAGFMPKPPSEKKEVKFADGVCPGEGTSTSECEEIATPPPKPKLPKEKRYKKKKTKVKKKVKVQIIRQIIQNEEDDEDDDLSPPPPPPGDPPPVFFARFPFAGDAQFPVYQTQTTTTTLTTVQFPAPTF